MSWSEKPAVGRIIPAVLILLLSLSTIFLGCEDPESANSPPVLTIDPDVVPILDYGEEVVLKISAEDPDNDSLVFSWYVDDVLQFGITGKQFTFSAKPTFEQIFKVRVVAADPYTTSEQTRAITVKGKGGVSSSSSVGGSFTTPVISITDGVSIDSDIQIENNQIITFTASTTNANSNTIVYSWFIDDYLYQSGLSDTFFFQRSVPDTTDFSLRVVGSDGLEEGEISILVTVQRPNTPPAGFISNGSITLVNNENVDLLADFTDGEGDAITYTWFIDGTQYQTGPSDTFSFSANVPTVTDFSVMVETFDGWIGGTSQDTVTVTVLPTVSIAETPFTPSFSSAAGTDTVSADGGFSIPGASYSHTGYFSDVITNSGFVIVAYNTGNDGQTLSVKSTAEPISTSSVWQPQLNFSSFSGEVFLEENSDGVFLAYRSGENIYIYLIENIGGAWAWTPLLSRNVTGITEFAYTANSSGHYYTVVVNGTDLYFDRAALGTPGTWAGSTDITPSFEDKESLTIISDEQDASRLTIAWQCPDTEELLFIQSTDNGVNWPSSAGTEGGFNTKFPFPAVVNGNTVMIQKSTDPLLHISGDGGTSWSEADPGLGGIKVEKPAMEFIGGTPEYAAVFYNPETQRVEFVSYLANGNLNRQTTVDSYSGDIGVEITNMFPKKGGPAIHHDSTGNTYITYRHNRRGFCISVSPDNGAAWTSETYTISNPGYRLSTQATSGFHADIAADPSSPTVYAIYDDPGTGQLLFSRSYNNGLNWETAELWSSSWSGQPSVAVDSGGNVHVSFGTNGGTYYGYSDTRGSTFSFRNIDTEYGDKDDITDVYAEGPDVFVAFQDYNDIAEFSISKLAYSPNGGSDWLITEITPAQPSIGQVGITLSGGTAFYTLGSNTGTLMLAESAFPFDNFSWTPGISGVNSKGRTILAEGTELYITADDYIYYSGNEGVTWNSADWYSVAGLSGSPVMADLTVDPGNIYISYFTEGTSELRIARLDSYNSAPSYTGIISSAAMGKNTAITWRNGRLYTIYRSSEGFGLVYSYSDDGGVSWN